MRHVEELRAQQQRFAPFTQRANTLSAFDLCNRSCSPVFDDFENLLSESSRQHQAVLNASRGLLNLHSGSPTAPNMQTLRPRFEQIESQNELFSRLRSHWGDWQCRRKLTPHRQEDDGNIEQCYRLIQQLHDSIPTFVSRTRAFLDTESGLGESSDHGNDVAPMGNIGCWVFVGRATLTDRQGQGHALGNGSARIPVFVHEVGRNSVLVTPKAQSANCKVGWVRNVSFRDSDRPDFVPPNDAELRACNRQCN